MDNATTKSKPPKRRVIAEEFTSYRMHVIPPQAGRAQIDECRRAFYGGAVAVFNAIVRCDLSDDVIENRMADIDDELVAYGVRARAQADEARQSVSMAAPARKPTPEEVMKAMASAIEAILNPGEKHNGFILLAFPLEDKGNLANFISNVDRERTLRILERFLQRNRDTAPKA